MTKSYKELIEWLKSPESRRYIRIWHFIQSIIFSTATFSCIVVLHFSNVKNGAMFYYPAILIAITQLTLAPVFLNNLVISRFLRKVILFLSLLATWCTSGFAFVYVLSQNAP